MGGILALHWLARPDAAHIYTPAEGPTETYILMIRVFQLASRTFCALAIASQGAAGLFSGSSGLSGVISSNRDKNVPTIVVSANQTADRRDIPVPLLRLQILLPHLSRKSHLYLDHCE